ncbi:MAG: alpha/beta fold hydrolase [Burkholderiaceae bacterium]|nr:alpha/beta fold hydrolase [Burkholderiaceae bacterium]
MITTVARTLPHGPTLHCRTSGPSGAPVLLFLHGFPEGAFVWDALLEHFSRPENGGYRCVAPWLRGFGPSSAPADAKDYRPKHLVQDILALIAIESPGAPLACLVAHDWGGAVAWNTANQFPQHMQRLAIINSPHPGTFLRELQTNPAQQAASAYMNFLIRPDAESLLAANDFQRMWRFLNRPDGTPPAWLDDATRAQYHATWSAGLTGGCNYYRASPLRPARPGDPAVDAVQLPRSMLTVDVPTWVLWGLDDIALLPSLLDGLDSYIPRLTLETVADADHWVIHTHPARVIAGLTAHLLRN